MKIGIPKEIFEGERCVAVVPKMVTQLKKDGQEVFVENDAGKEAYFSNSEYEQAGATIVTDTQQLYKESEVIMKIWPPQNNTIIGKHEVEMMQPSSIYLGFLSPVSNLSIIQQMTKKNMTGFAIEFMPRLARSQSMDALSSMASVAGYRAALIAAQLLGKYFPLMMTAAGTIPPAKVLVIGAGVAGLQAIATARRLGAKVEAFDTRHAVKEQVKSLGAQFIEMELVEDAETAGGYAKEMTDEFIKKEQETIASRAVQNDVVITTAQVFGKKAPILITEEIVKKMQEGSVIIDLAAEQGGNCELTKAGKNIDSYGVTICGAVNLSSTVPIDASRMYSKNITNFFNHLYKTRDGSLDFEDEITKSTCIIHKGEIVNETVRKTLQKGGISA